MTGPVSDLIYFRGRRRNAARHCDLRGTRRRGFGDRSFPRAFRSSITGVTIGNKRRGTRETLGTGGAVAVHDVDARSSLATDSNDRPALREIIRSMATRS
jgi:hypothetical protein